MENNSRIKNIGVNLPVFMKEIKCELKKERRSYRNTMIYTTIFPTAKNKEIKETTRESDLELKDQLKRFKTDQKKQKQLTKNPKENDMMDAVALFDEHVNSHMNRTRSHINHVQEIKARTR